MHKVIQTQHRCMLTSLICFTTIIHSYLYYYHLFVPTSLPQAELSKIPTTTVWATQRIIVGATSDYEAQVCV